MRLAALALLLLATPASAETLSAEIAHDGLAKVEARLAALPAPTAEEVFGLGGVQFLRAVEISFQDRWAAGLTDRTGMLPFLRMPLQDNPKPAAFDPSAVVNVFVHAGDRLATAKATLASLPDSAEFGLEIALDDLWFDVNTNGTRDGGEGIADILGAAVFGSQTTTLPTIRFDTADAAWLSAYADLLMAICDMVRAYDPTEPLTRIASAREAMGKLGPLYPDMILGGNDPARLDTIDLLAVIVASLQQQPDKARMASAHDHLQAMVDENRAFWARVEKETDDDREWLPNDRQHAALGIEVPQGTGAHWQAVLADIESVLKGEKLLPYWRAGEPAGFNLAKWFDNPGPIDLAGWIQGWAVLPYLEKGTVIGPDSLCAFDRLTQGQSMLFALYLN